MDADEAASEGVVDSTAVVAFHSGAHTVEEDTAAGDEATHHTSRTLPGHIEFDSVTVPGIMSATEKEESGHEHGHGHGHGPGWHGTGTDRHGNGMDGGSFGS